MISTRLARATAVMLFLGGLALLFVPDLVLPLLVPGYPSEGLWLGQIYGWLLLRGPFESDLRSQRSASDRAVP